MHIIFLILLSFLISQQSVGLPIGLSNDQIIRFAGNAIELKGRDKNILALSNNAYNSLTTEQISIISNSVTLVPLEIPTIELSGGSVRCTIADIHLLPRNHL